MNMWVLDGSRIAEVNVHRCNSPDWFEVIDPEHPSGGYYAELGKHVFETKADAITARLNYLDNVVKSSTEEIALLEQELEQELENGTT